MKYLRFFATMLLYVVLGIVILNYFELVEIYKPFHITTGLLLFHGILLNMIVSKYEIREIFRDIVKE